MLAFTPPDFIRSGVNEFSLTRLLISSQIVTHLSPEPVNDRRDRTKFLRFLLAVDERKISMKNEITAYSYTDFIDLSPHSGRFALLEPRP